MDLPEVQKLTLMQTVSAGHMRVVDGVGTLLQMEGLCAKLATDARELKVVLAAPGAKAAGGGASSTAAGGAAAAASGGAAAGKA